MTTVNAFVAGAESAATGAAAAASPLGQLGSQGFLNLLVAQLRYQDPMNPGDTSALMTQTSQLTQVETMQTLAKTQSQLLAMQQTTLAEGLLGEQVVAVDAAGAETSGKVDAVRFAATGPVLVIGGDEFGLGQIREFRDVTDAG